MDSYAISLQDPDDLSETVVVVNNATFEDDALDKLEKAGWLENYAILDATKIKAVIS